MYLREGPSCHTSCRRSAWWLSRPACIGRQSKDTTSRSSQRGIALGPFVHPRESQPGAPPVSIGCRVGEYWAAMVRHRRLRRYRCSRTGSLARVTRPHDVNWTYLNLTAAERRCAQKNRRKEKTPLERTSLRGHTHTSHFEHVERVSRTWPKGLRGPPVLPEKHA